MNAERNWRAGHEGRDPVYYEEFHHGVWRRLAIGGEILSGRAHHVLYFGARAAWSAQPEWARARRDEIIARIKSVFAIPDYEYEDGRRSAARQTALQDHDEVTLDALTAFPAMTARSASA